ncbi:hypothetical protein ACVQ8P_03735 [Dellaglioa sp. BT-FLS60]
MAQKFYGSKININGNIFNQNVKEIKMSLIPEKIKQYDNKNKENRFIKQKSNQNSKIQNIEWTLANIVQISDDILSGDIVKKFQRSIEQLVGARTQKTFRDEAEKVHFFYFIETEILLCQTKTDISYEEAFEHFKMLLDHNDEQIGYLNIQLLTRVDEFETELFSDTIQKIKLNYVVPNDPDTLNSISDILLDNNASTGKFEIENKEKGIKSYEQDGSKSKLVLNLLEIMKKGFGSIEARIGNRRHSKSIKSKEFPVSARIEESDLKDIKAIEKLKKDIIE